MGLTGDCTQHAMNSTRPETKTPEGELTSLTSTLGRTMHSPDKSTKLQYVSTPAWNSSSPGSYVFTSALRTRNLSALQGSQEKISSCRSASSTSSCGLSSPSSDALGDTGMSMLFRSV
jgi:hypothetical protein